MKRDITTAHAAAERFAWTILVILTAFVASAMIVETDGCGLAPIVEAK